MTWRRGLSRIFKFVESKCHILRKSDKTVFLPIWLNLSPNLNILVIFYWLQPGVPLQVISITTMDCITLVTQQFANASAPTGSLEYGFSFPTIPCCLPETQSIFFFSFFSFFFFWMISSKRDLIFVTNTANTSVATAPAPPAPSPPSQG